MGLNYDPTIPQPQDILQDSQSDLLTNYQDISTYLNINHEDFTSVNFGKHKFVTLTSQTDGLTTLPNEIGLFNKNDAFGNPQLFYRNAGTEAAADTKDTQLTPIPSIWAWGIFDNTGALTVSYNIKNITTGGTGVFTINFNNDLGSTNYFPWFMPRTSGNSVYPNITNATTNSLTVNFFKSATAKNVINTCSFIIWGDK